MCQHTQTREAGGHGTGQEVQILSGSEITQSVHISQLSNMGHTSASLFVENTRAGQLSIAVPEAQVYTSETQRNAN